MQDSDERCTIGCQKVFSLQMLIHVSLVESIYVFHNLIKKFIICFSKSCGKASRLLLKNLPINSPKISSQVYQYTGVFEDTGCVYDVSLCVEV